LIQEFFEEDKTGFSVAAWEFVVAMESVAIRAWRLFLF
jgi:hypothetical protein